MGRGSWKGAWILCECAALLPHGGRGPDHSLTLDLHCVHMLALLRVLINIYCI